MVCVISYLKLIFQLSAVGLVYHFPTVAHVRVSWRLLLGISFPRDTSWYKFVAALFFNTHSCYRAESGEKPMREGRESYILSNRIVLRESSSNWILETYFRAASSPALLQTKERSWAGMIMVLTVFVVVLSVWTLNGAFLLLLNDCYCAGRAEVLLQSCKIWKKIRTETWRFVNQVIKPKLEGSKSIARI